MRELRAFHLAVAHRDCSLAVEDQCSEDEVSFTDFPRQSNDCSLSAQLQARDFDSDVVGGDPVCREFPQLFRQLWDWLISLDEGASEQRIVGWIEVYVAFCLFRSSDQPLLAVTGQCEGFHHVTFAADYKFFRKLLFAILAIINRARFPFLFHNQVFLLVGHVMSRRKPFRCCVNSWVIALSETHRLCQSHGGCILLHRCCPMLGTVWLQ